MPKLFFGHYWLIQLRLGWYKINQNQCLNCRQYYIGVLFFEQVIFLRQFPNSDKPKKI